VQKKWQKNFITFGIFLRASTLTKTLLFDQQHNPEKNFANARLVQ